MKRIFAFAVAALTFVAASSVQAVEVKLHTFSRAADQISQSASDVKVTLLDQDQNVVTEQEGTGEVNFDVPAGDYTVVAEQESTGFNGQHLLPVGEEGFLGSATLSSFGLLITDYGKEDLNNKALVQQTVTPANSLTSVPSLPQVPAPAANYGVAAGYGAYGGMNSLMILGVVGGMIATTIAVTADDDNDHFPASGGYRFR